MTVLDGSGLSVQQDSYVTAARGTVGISPEAVRSVALTGITQESPDVVHGYTDLRRLVALTVAVNISAVKASVHTQQSVVVERLDLNSGYGNAMLLQTLVRSGSAVGGLGLGWSKQKGGGGATGAAGSTANVDGAGAGAALVGLSKGLMTLAATVNMASSKHKEIVKKAPLLITALCVETG